MGDYNQEEIDRLLSEAIDEGADSKDTNGGASNHASQEDIDALFATVVDGTGNDNGSGFNAGEGADPSDDLGGLADQADIDALFAAAGHGPASEEEPDDAPVPAPASEPGLEDMTGAADQADIDALFASVAANIPNPVAIPESALAASADLALTDTEYTDTVHFSDADDDDDDEMPGNSSLDALLSSITASSGAVDGEGDESDSASEQEKSFDMDALMDQIIDDASASEPAADPAADINAVTVILPSSAFQVPDDPSAPPLPPPPTPPAPSPEAGMYDDAAATLILEDSVLGEHGAPLVAAPGPVAPPPPAPVPTPAPAPVPVPRSFAPPPAPVPYSIPASMPLPPMPASMQSMPSAPRDALSVMSSAGEVESMAGQISGMLGQLSEKAHRYMQAWFAADSEAKELRVRLHTEERFKAVVQGERDALAKELEFVRNKMGTVEGEKIGIEESKRTVEATFHSQVRELESRVTIQASELDSLKNELTRARTEATGIDIESRRSRFEADRLKNEVDAERMERIRIQRALENREKELQAMQAQSSGQASSLFIDELHRLVRRLESELDARTSGAHEALRQLDRLDAPENMVPVVANLRAALMQAMGADDSHDDAIRSLGREAGRVRGPQGLAPGKTEMLSFESALSTYDFLGALDTAGALLREVKATPAALMRRVYQCPALRRTEVAEHLSDLSRLLEGLRTVQESADRARGGESGESEVFYVQMFDFLHNLVRLKVVNRMAGEIWRIFLDLRGRFSFVTSDKQWSEYRDNVLGKTAPE